jgi:hypothetical protein
MMMRSALFWDIMQRRVVILYRCFGTIYGSHLQAGLLDPRSWDWVCPETSVKDYHWTLRNIPEERRSHMYILYAFTTCHDQRSLLHSPTKAMCPTIQGPLVQLHFMQLALTPWHNVRASRSKSFLKRQHFTLHSAFRCVKEGRHDIKLTFAEPNTDRSLQNETRSLEISDDCTPVYSDSREYDSGNYRTLLTTLLY